MPDNSNHPSFVCGEEDAGTRLDKFVTARFEDVSRSQIQKWIEEDLARVNGIPSRKNTVLNSGDTVEIEIPPQPVANHLEPEDIPLNIVYEDEYLAVVDKPKGMVTHPGNGVRSGTLANALAYHFKQLSDLGGWDRPGIVHRLDRDTTGLLVVARDNITHAALSKQLEEHQIRRTYEAICWRELSPANGLFDSPLGRHPTDPLRRAVRDNGKTAVTHYRVLDWFHFVSHLEIRLETGRTHQIRVHLSHAGYPIVGDALYGGGDTMLGRTQPLYHGRAVGLLKLLSSQALHSARLVFEHPRKNETLEFRAPTPREFSAALEYLQPYKREIES